MVSPLQSPLVVVILVSFVLFVASKHVHKQSHGPLRPAGSIVTHGKANLLKRTHHVFNHHDGTRVDAHLKRRHYSRHKHQHKLHLKAHKKAVTYAKAPAEPQACIDFLPCLQYRYYHCHSHEWIRNNCPKLCLYCEHQPFPEPMYGRFKAVAAAYPDWCLDHSQCVAYPTEACAYDSWMQVNCLRKCDVCYKDKKVKAGLVFVGPPFDQTEEQRKEEHQLNKILQFRPTSAPSKMKANDDKGTWSADSANGTAPARWSADSANRTAPAPAPAVAMNNKPIPPAKPVAQNITPNPGKLNALLASQSLAAGKVDSTPARQSLTAEKSYATPPSQPQPAAVKPPATSLKPVYRGNNSIGIPAYSYEDMVKQELEVAKEAPAMKQFKADVFKEVQIKLRTGKVPQMNTAKVFAKHRVTKPKRKHVVESLTTPKHQVSKPKRREYSLKHKVGKKIAKDDGGNVKKVVEEKSKKRAKGFRGRKTGLRKDAKGEKRRNKVMPRGNKIEKSVRRKGNSHITNYGKKGKHRVIS